MDEGTVISSGCGGKPPWDKRAFPGTPVTPLNHCCFRGETLIKVQICSSILEKKEGVKRKVGDVLVFHHISHFLLLPMALFLCLVGLETDR